MRWLKFVVLAMVLMAAMGSADPDDACVKRTASNYLEGFKSFKMQVNALKGKRNAAGSNSANGSAQSSEDQKIRVTPPYISGEVSHVPFEHSNSEFFDAVSYETNCRFPPFKIVKDNSTICPYPGPLPSYCNSGKYQTQTDVEKAISNDKAMSEPSCNMNTSASGKVDNQSASGKLPIPYPFPFPIPNPAPLLGKITTFARSVGRLKLRSTYHLSQEEVEKSKELAGKCKKGDEKSKGPAGKNKDLYTCEQVELWGTGFMVGNTIFAASCHVIAPLVQKDDYGNPQLHLDDGEALFVNFTATDVQPNDNDDFQVNKLAGCSSRDGLDIALLEVEPVNKAKTKLPDALPLFTGKIGDLEHAATGDSEAYWRIGVLMGYGDLLHPIDETTWEMYRPYEKGPYDNIKAVMLDGIISEDECDDDLGIVLDTTDTTVGESGAIVMDSLHWFDQNSPAFVLGVHTCCSAFFGPQTYTTPQPELRCARLNRTFHNQDISSRSILRDRTLCPILYDHYGQMTDGKTPPMRISCNDVKWEWPISWKTFYK